MLSYCQDEACDRNGRGGGHEEPVRARHAAPKADVERDPSDRRLSS